MSESTYISTCKTEELTPEERTEVAKWIFSMDVDYYTCFSEDSRAITSQIIKLMSDKDSDFYPTLAAKQQASLIGFLTFYPGEEAYSRRLHVMKSLLQLVTDPQSVRLRLKRYEGAKTQPPRKSIYLSKIYLHETMRKKNLSKELLRPFLEAGISSGCALSLHVHEANHPAISLYSQHGFTPSQAQNAPPPYLLMTLDPYDR